MNWNFKNIAKLSILVITILVGIGYVFHMHTLGLGEFVWMTIFGALVWLCSKINFKNISREFNKFLDED